MSDDNLDDLARHISAPFTTTAGSALVQIASPLLGLLVRGEPVTVTELAAKSGRSPDALRAMHQRFSDIEWDEQGRIVGAGLSLRPTPHRIALDGRTLYGWCALDTLVFATCIEQPLSIESRCPATGDLVTITVNPAGVATPHPETAVLSVVALDELDNLRGRLCAHSHFFASTSAASEWLDSQSATTILPVHAGLRLGRLIADEFLAADGQATFRQN